MKSYSISLQQGVAEPLGLDDTSDPWIHFYWIDGGSALVSVNATVGNDSLYAGTSFNIAEPSPQGITYNQGVTILDVTPATATIHYGDAAGVEGMEFTGTVTAPVGYGGQVAFIQLVSSTLRYNDNNNDSFVFTTTGHGYVLDRDGNVVYYNSQTASMSAGGTGAVTCEDSPSMGRPINYYLLQTDFDFADFLMFKPNSSDSIWVTVRKFRWEWSATAENTGVVSNYWETTAFQQPPPVQGASPQLPEWDARWQDLIINPGYQQQP